MNSAYSRIDWVDYAKGICIILVVMMHSTLGVEKAIGQTGHLSSFIEWARPFRMPDFFLISGLFLSRRIDGNWRDYLDKKVLHFAYFYVLWMSIQFALKGPGIYQAEGLGALLGSYAMGFIEPFGTLWFIYLLAIFFVVTKAVKNLPPLLIFAAAALLEMAPVATGSLIIDEFAARYVYFFTGYWLAGIIIASADRMWSRSGVALMAMIYIWATGHSMAMVMGMSNLPGISLVLGFAGAGAVIGLAILLARSEGVAWLRYLGANSIVIYLSFFMFMAATRTLGLKLWPTINPDVLSTMTTFAGVAGPMLMYWMLGESRLKFLFKRPQWVSLKRVETAAKPTYSARHDIILKQPQVR